MTEASQLRDWQTPTRDVRRRVRLGMTRNFKFKFESSPVRHAATHWQFKLNLTINAESKPLLVNGRQFQWHFQCSEPPWLCRRGLPGQPEPTWLGLGANRRGVGMQCKPRLRGAATAVPLRHWRALSQAGRRSQDSGWHYCWVRVKWQLELEGQLAQPGSGITGFRAGEPGRERLGAWESYYNHDGECAQDYCLDRAWQLSWW